MKYQDQEISEEDEEAMKKSNLNMKIEKRIREIDETDSSEDEQI